MKKERIKLLDKIGFDWTEMQNDEGKWMTKYNDVKKLIPVGENLCTFTFNNETHPRWLHEQRASRRKGYRRMTEERIELLDKIGFDWTEQCKTNDAKWMTKYNELIDLIPVGDDLSIELLDKIGMKWY